MEIEWIRENMETEQVVPLQAVQIAVETEAALPGGLREEARVLHADALAAVSGGEWAGGRAAVDGKVTFHVLYTQGDMDRVRSLEATADFSQSMTAEGALPAQAAVHPRAEVIGVSAKAFNGRVLLRAALQLSGDAAGVRTVSCLKGVVDAPQVQQLSQTVSLENTVGEGQGQTLLREEFELSDVLQITETLYASAQARVEDILGGADGRATVTGTVFLEAWHASDMPGRPLVNTRHTVPFEHVVALSGALGDALAARSEVRDTAVLSQENEDGSRVLRAEVQLFSEISAVAEKETTLLRDVFTLSGNGIAAAAEEVSVRSGTVTEQTEAPCRLVMQLDAGDPRVKTPLAGFALPVIGQARADHGELTVEGVMNLTLIYLADGSAAPVSASQETPFRAVFATAGLPEDHLALTAGEVELNALTGDRVEFRCALHLSAEGVRQTAVRVLTGAESVPEGESAKGICLYYPQAGEDVWEIAKRYRMPQDAILALNPRLAEQKSEGAPVLVYRR